MPDRRPPEPDPERLSEPVATRVLARASEMDAARSTESTVAQLRAAAAEAGISAPAFDAALAEVRGAAQPQGLELSGQPRRRSRLAVATTAFVVVALAGALYIARRTPTATVAAATPVVEQTFVLRCLSPVEAAELIRPILLLPANTVVISPARAPRVLTIRATPEQIQTVRSLLDKYEGSGSPACAATKAPATTR